MAYESLVISPRLPVSHLGGGPAFYADDKLRGATSRQKINP